jgi:hypothetical protein
MHSLHRRQRHVFGTALAGPALLLAGCAWASWDSDLAAYSTAQDQTELPPGQSPEGQTNQELAKKTQNPVSDLISLPFQNNTNFGLGPTDETQNILNIQPVVPVSLSDDWLLINRVIMPIVYQPEVIPGSGSEFGLGDTTYTAFFSPKGSGEWIWGAGPIVQIPTSTDDRLGSGVWGLGPSVVAVTMPAPWVIGGVVSNVWSVGTDSNDPDVNFFFLQPFINYNFEGGWYLTSAPIITADWEAPSDDRWTVPLGGGFGKVFRVGSRPMNFNTQVFYNVEHPDLGAEWQLRLQLALLF